MVSINLESGEICETITRVGNYPPGHQLIFIEVLEWLRADCLLKVEACGKFGFARLSEIKSLGVNFSETSKRGEFR